MSEPVLYKKHLRPCRLRAGSDTACDCPWRARYKIHDIDLAEWVGEPLDPRKKRPATAALGKLWVSDYIKGFSPLGYRHSLSIGDLLEKPHLSRNLDPAQKQIFIRYAAEHLSAAQALLDTLEAYLFYDERARLALYRKPLNITRALVRLDRGKGFSFETLQELLPREPARSLRRRLADLVTDGLLIQPDHWQATEAGQSFQGVSRKQIQRDTADRIVEEFALRVRRINASDSLAYRVQDAVLFGSYLGDEPIIGDVDIAVRFAPRFEDEKQQAALEEKIQNQAPSQRNMIEVICWPKTEVQRMLRGRSKIDVRDLSELEDLIREQRQKGKRLRTRVLVGDWRPPR